MRLFLVLFSVALAGCAIAQDPGADALIAPDLRFATPGPGALGREIDAVQMITAHYRDQSFTFEGRISVAPDKLVLAGLDGFGRRAITVTRTSQGIDIDAAPWLPASLRAANILADLAMLYWPESAVQGGLSGPEAVVKSEGKVRSILWRGKEVVHIDYETSGQDHWGESARLRNPAFVYELDSRSAVIAD